jgi:hypothetical protein
MFPDPFVERSPLWQRYSGRPPDYDLGQVDSEASDLYAFLRENAPVRKPAPEPRLPRGMSLRDLGDGRFTLIYPDGASGYRAIDGGREELIQLAHSMTTE